VRHPPCMAWFIGFAIVCQVRHEHRTIRVCYGSTKSTQNAGNICPDCSLEKLFSKDQGDRQHSEDFQTLLSAAGGSTLSPNRRMARGNELILRSRQRVECFANFCNPKTPAGCFWGTRSILPPHQSSKWFMPLNLAGFLLLTQVRDQRNAACELCCRRMTVKATQTHSEAVQATG